MAVLDWHYELGFNLLLCILFVTSIQQICVSSIHDKMAKYRYLTSVYCTSAWVENIIILLHYQFFEDHLIVFILRISIAINICVGSFASFNFVVKSVEAIYHQRAPHSIYYSYSSKSVRKSPNWFHHAWYIILVLNIIALILSYSLAIFFRNGRFFSFYDFILDIIMILGCIVTFIALCNVTCQLHTVVNSSKQNVKLLEKKNALYYIEQNKLSQKTLSTIRKTVSNEIKIVSNKSFDNGFVGYNPSIQNVYQSLEGAAILSLSDTQDIDLRELSKRITIEQHSKRKYKILRQSKRKMDIMLFFMFIFLIAASYDLVSQIRSFDWTNFDQPLFISPYPNIYSYIAHYTVDVQIIIVLIVWVYIPTKMCKNIRRDSIIALVCCVCCIIDNGDFDSPTKSNSSDIYYRNDGGDATFKCDTTKTVTEKDITIHQTMTNTTVDDTQIFITPHT
eukprot:104022_1